MEKKIFYLIFVTLICLYFYFDLKKTIDSTIPNVEETKIIIPSIPSLKIEIPHDVVLDDIKLWNLKIKNINIILDLSKDNKKKENRCIRYIVEKEGKLYSINISNGRSLQLLGIVKIGKDFFAIIYDKKNKKITLVKKGNKVDEFLLLKQISYNKVILENISDCPEKQTFVLEIFSINLEQFKKKENEEKK